MVFVRQRPAIVREVMTKNEPQINKVQHLVDIEYIDGWNWERAFNGVIFRSLI